jgi:hypothetical protein
MDIETVTLAVVPPLVNMAVITSAICSIVPFTDADPLCSVYALISPPSPAEQLWPAGRTAVEPVRSATNVHEPPPVGDAIVIDMLSPEAELIVTSMGLELIVDVEPASCPC